MQISKKEWPLLSLCGFRKRIDNDRTIKGGLSGLSRKCNYWLKPYCVVMTCQKSTGVRLAKIGEMWGAEALEAIESFGTGHEPPLVAAKVQFVAILFAALCVSMRRAMLAGDLHHA
jgi:hypothetical protein